jgi:hypothetical protein
MTVTDADRLLFITTQLGESYFAWKEEEKNKETDRKAFFELAIAANKHAPVRTKVVEVKIKSGFGSIEEAMARAGQKHPRFLVQGGQENGETARGETLYKVILEEDPKWLDFTYINEHDGNVYCRKVEDGKMNIDADRMEAEDPELFKSVTMETWGGDRIIMPFAFMEDAVLQKVQPYIYQSTPVAKLSPVRAAKPEELEEA